MPNVTAGNVQAWVEQTKLTVGELDVELEAQVADEVYSRLALPKPASPAETPAIVRSIISMLYAAAFIQRAYSEDDALSAYAGWLTARAERMIGGILDGSVVLDPTAERVGGASGYPDDTVEPSFTMGQIF